VPKICFFLALALIATACSGPSRPDPVAGWQNIVADFTSGDVDRTWETISVKSQKMFDELDHKDHPERTNGGKVAFGLAFAKKNPFPESKAELAEMRGEIAILKVSADGKPPSEMWIVFEKGRWRMAFAEMDEAGKWPPPPYKN
jgi:hypothetical protein